MYSIYLLDDEPFILEGLKYILPWEEYGFEIVGSASNGEDGLKEILDKNIDLVITDIMMPKMTGLELISELKMRGYQCNFIVLSAFQEFEYAKKAISMGAENYLLKPIDIDELSNTIKIINNKIRKKEKYIEDNQVIKNNLLMNLVSKQDNKDCIIELENIGISIKEQKYRIVMLELKDATKNIEKILKSLNKYEELLYCIESNSKAIIILNEETDVVIDKLTDLKNNITEISNEIIYISLGSKVDDLSELYKSYDTAKQVSEYKIVYPDISWIKEYKEEVLNKDILDIEFETLKKIVMDKDFSKTCLFIEDTFNKLKKQEDIKPQQIKLKAIEIFLNVYNYFNESKLMKGLNTYLESAINSNTVNEIENYLIDMIKYMQSKLEQTQESISPIVLKLLQYIEENYKNDLNLKEISDNLNINSIYLGQLFQKETGTLFSDYINNFRINKAKDLLVNTSLKASEIGDLVGYANKNYFYRKFKNIVGVTPSEWRKINI